MPVKTPRGALRLVRTLIGLARMSREPKDEIPHGMAETVTAPGVHRG